MLESAHLVGGAEIEYSQTVYLAHEETVNRIVKYGTALVLAHLMVNIIHGAAHRELGVELSPAAMLFVIGIILLCPLFAMVLLWTSHKRVGLVILTLSLAASLVFGLYNHFAVRGPDHVGELGPSPWGAAFVLTAYLLIVTEAMGTYMGLYFLYRMVRPSKAFG
jgi:hypothetical protein